MLGNLILAVLVFNRSNRVQFRSLSFDVTSIWKFKFNTLRITQPELICELPSTRCAYYSKWGDVLCMLACRDTWNKRQSLLVTRPQTERNLRVNIERELERRYVHNSWCDSVSRRGGGLNFDYVAGGINILYHSFGSSIHITQIVR